MYSISIRNLTHLPCPEGDWPFNRIVLNLFWDPSEYIGIFYHFSILRWHSLLKSFLLEYNYPSILHMDLPHKGPVMQKMNHGIFLEVNSPDICLYQHLMGYFKNLTNYLFDYTKRLPGSIIMLYTVEYHYNAVHYNIILYTPLWWLGQNMNVSLNPWKTTYISL